MTSDPAPAGLMGPKVRHVEDSEQKVDFLLVSSDCKGMKLLLGFRLPLSQQRNFLLSLLLLPVVGQTVLMQMCRRRCPEAPPVRLDGSESELEDDPWERAEINRLLCCNLETVFINSGQDRRGEGGSD